MWMDGLRSLSVKKRRTADGRRCGYLHVPADPTAKVGTRIPFRARCVLCG